MPKAPELSGRALDARYELHEVLGEGTFGCVYRAVDRRLGRPVAVKVIKPWWAEDTTWVERFEREARLLARVNDPGVLQVFDIGTAREGPYYVTELVDGESLAERLAAGALAAAEARRIAERLCLALGSAHAQSVVHCDVKPANVLLAADGRVKVGDFGVARHAEIGSQLPSATVAGTPRYMCPELALGRAPTPAADVYSAGVVLYEMLAGRPPFEDGPPVVLGLRHLQEAPPPLPAEIPRALRVVVVRALAKDPAERYLDGRAMAAALHAARDRSSRGDEDSGDEPAPEKRVGARPPKPAPPSAARTPRYGAPDPRPATPATVAAGLVNHDRPATRAASTSALTLPRRRSQPARAETIARRRSRAPDAREGRVGRWRRGGDGGGPIDRSGGRSLHDPRRRRALAIAAGVALAASAGAAVLLTAGGARRAVPKLRGLPRDVALARLARVHLHASFASSYEEVPRGLAVAQAPRAGTRVPEGSTVAVLLSAGPPPVAVPNVAGEGAAAAAGRIDAAHLRYRARTVVAPGTSAGVVVRQSPAPPARVPRGTTVALDVAETPRWRALTTFAGIDDGTSVPFRIRGSRWSVTYDMTIRGLCVLLVVCEGPSASVHNTSGGTSFGNFELQEGEAQTHTFTSGPGVYRLQVSGGRDSASWSMTIEDYY